MKHAFDVDLIKNRVGMCRRGIIRLSWSFRLPVALVIVGVLATALWNWSSQSSATSLTSSPVLLNPVDVDLGCLLQGDVGQFRVQLRNVSKEPLEIVRVRGTCTCIQVTECPQVLLPGCTGELNGKLQVGSLTGTVRDRVMIEFKASREAVFRVNATVVPRYVAEPSTLDFGHVALSSSVEKQVVVVCRSPLDRIDHLQLDNLQPPLVARIVKMSGTTAEIKIKMEQGSVGEARQSLVACTNDPRQPRLVIPIICVVDGPVRVTPQHLYLGSISGEKPVSCRLLLQATGVQPLEIERIHVGKTPVTIEITQEPTNPREAVAILQFDLSRVNGLVEDEVTVETANPKFECRVPVVALVSPGRKIP